jgi:Transposase
MDRQYVGIDFHRRRSVIVRKNSAGEKLSSARVPNDPLAIAAAVAEAGPEPEVVIEATYGWYWIVDWLQEQGATVHLANPSGLNWGTRRVKNDERDAVDLVDMLRLGRLPEAWIAPPATRELRELVRYRAKLVALRSGLKAQVHAVMAKEGVLPAVTDMFCQAGNTQLDEMRHFTSGAPRAPRGARYLKRRIPPSTPTATPTAANFGVRRRTSAWWLTHSSADVHELCRTYVPGLITRRSKVQILPPPPSKRRSEAPDDESGAFLCPGLSPMSLGTLNRLS